MIEEVYLHFQVIALILSMMKPCVGNSRPILLTIVDTFF